jgi:integrase
VYYNAILRIRGKNFHTVSEGHFDSLNKRSSRIRIATGESRTSRKGRKRGLIRVSGGDGAAARTIRLLPSILFYAIDMGLIASSPALGLKLAPGGQCHRYLSPEEVRRLEAVLDQPVRSPAAATAVTVVRLLILPGARRGEIEDLKWSEVDFRFGMLRKETSRTGARVIPRELRCRSSRSRGSGPRATSSGFSAAPQSG